MKRHKIRFARSGEHDLISALSQRTFRQKFEHLYAPDDIAAFLADKHAPAVYQKLIVDENSALWLVEDDEGALIGYGSAGPCDLPVEDMPARSGELQRLYLERAYWGRGIGSALLQEILAWLDQRFDHLYLSVYSENFDAQRLYRRHGFEKVRDYIYMVGNHEDDEWIMGRPSRQSG